MKWVIQLPSLPVNPPFCNGWGAICVGTAGYTWLGPELHKGSRGLTADCHGGGIVHLSGTASAWRWWRLMIRVGRDCMRLKKFMFSVAVVCGSNSRLTRNILRCHKMARIRLSWRCVRIGNCFDAWNAARCTFEVTYTLERVYDESFFRVRNLGHGRCEGTHPLGDLPADEG